MYYLLAFYALSGDMLPEDQWARNKKYPSIEACTEKRVQYQDVINKAWLKDNNGTLVEFKCLLGKEILA